MNRFIQAGAVVCLLATATFGAAPEKYLHVRVTNVSEANQYLSRQYRTGW